MDDAFPALVVDFVGLRSHVCFGRLSGIQIIWPTDRKFWATTVPIFVLQFDLTAQQRRILCLSTSSESTHRASLYPLSLRDIVSTAITGTATLPLPSFSKPLSRYISATVHEGWPNRPTTNEVLSCSLPSTYKPPPAGL